MNIYSPPLTVGSLLITNVPSSPITAPLNVTVFPLAALRLIVPELYISTYSAKLVLFVNTVLFMVTVPSTLLVINGVVNPEILAILFKINVCPEPTVTPPLLLPFIP